MASNYQEISTYNEEQLGKDRASRKSQVAMYTDPVHFIFELLQNADDACATKISFTVTSEQLIIEHNGEPFTESNVKAISYFEKSDKTESGEEITKIGHFGLGFKSVFAYTASPHVYSGQESFKITQLYCVEAVPYPTDLEKSQTRFVLPFDHLIEKPVYIENRNLKSPELAYKDIAGKLEKLGANTLLFTKSLQEIKWATQENSGHYQRDTISISNETKEVCINTSALEQYCYLVFERPIFWSEDDGVEKQHRPVQIAFELDKPLKRDGVIRKINNAQLFVVFPTTKETHVGFILQGAYRTNPARENVFPDDEFNQYLVNQTAELLTESLHQLKKLQFLNLDVLSVLPLDQNKFSTGTFFEPLYLQVREALKTQPLLPAQGGVFITANEAKLANVQWLVGLFSPKQLGVLFDKQQLFWLDESITESGIYKDIYAYLKHLVSDIEVSVDNKLTSKLTANFFSKQSINWLIQFMLYAEGNKALKNLPFIRLQTGEQVVLSEKSDLTPTAHFQPKQAEKLDLSIFPLVHAELTANKTVREFLEKEGISEIDAVDIVVKSILPKYQNPIMTFDESDYRADLCLIYTAYVESNDKSKTKFCNELKNVAWLACVHASGNMPDKIVWKNPNEETLFERNEEHEIWFNGLEDCNAYFLHSSISAELNENFVNTVIKPITELTKNLTADDSKGVTLSNSRNYNKKGLDGFHPDAEIIGLRKVLADWNIDRCRILWKILLNAPRIINGKTQFSKNRSGLDTAEKKLEYTETGKLLCQSEYKWLPEKQENWHKPSELLPTDLPDEFETNSFRAKEVAEKLDMKKPEVEQAIDIIAGDDPNLRRLIESYKSGSDADREKMLKIIPQEVPPQPASSFKEAIKNLFRPQRGVISSTDIDNSDDSLDYPERYQNNLNRKVEENVKQHQTTPKTIHFSVVSELPSNKNAREFLYDQYQGQCQITGNTFPKASANANGQAENYFEAYSLFSYGNADHLNNEGNMLCVSADTMAKLKTASFEWLDDLETIIDNFEQRATGEMNTVAVKIRLANEECEITWSERHFSRLVALWNKA